MIAQGNKQKAKDKRCNRELHGAIPPVVYNYIHGCKTAQVIWNTLKEKFQGNERTKKSSVTQCLSELEDFKKKENETTKVYYDHFNELIYTYTKYGVVNT